MTTDEEKSKICKLLQGVEVPEIKLTARCSGLVKEFHKRFDKEVQDENDHGVQNEIYENPYRPDPQLLEENEKKIKELLAGSKRVKTASENIASATNQDPKRPWRTSANKEKLMRIEGELKRHLEKSSQLITPLAETEMQNLIKECREESRAAPPIGMNRLRDTVVAARKNLPNFQYKNISNSTATAIMFEAHNIELKNVQSLECVQE